MLSSSRPALCALSCLAGMATAGAAPIAYSEGGDLGAFAAPLSLGALGVGLNTIRGAVACDSTSCSDNHDLFSVTLAAGDRIVAAQLEFLSYTNTTARPGFNPQIHARSSGSLRDALPNRTVSPFSWVLSTGLFTGFTGSMAGAGDLGIAIDIYYPPADVADNDPFAWTAAASYEVRIQVEGATPAVHPAPEPASLALSLAGLAAALAGSGMARRRRAGVQRTVSVKLA